MAASAQQQEEKYLEMLVLDDLNSTDEAVLVQTLINKLRDLFRQKESQDVELQTKRRSEFVLLCGHGAVVRVMNAHLQCKII